jgi:predicted amidophosphoribosyltransferase
MITVTEAQVVDGVVQNKSEVKLLCASCGYDIDKTELAADTCSDCGAPLHLAQSVQIFVAAAPAAVSTTLV